MVDLSLIMCRHFDVGTIFLSLSGGTFSFTRYCEEVLFSCHCKEVLFLVIARRLFFLSLRGGTTKQSPNVNPIVN